MNIDGITLAPKDILEKEFKVDTRGYRPVDVDKFLDEIITNYEKMIKLVRKLKIEESEFKNEILDLKEQLRNAKTNIEIATRSERNGNTITNVDILKRLSDLEKTIYGK